jgi:hypothetical protein
MFGKTGLTLPVVASSNLVAPTINKQPLGRFPEWLFYFVTPYCLSLSQLLSAGCFVFFKDGDCRASTSVLVCVA